MALSLNQLCLNGLFAGLCLTACNAAVADDQPSPLLTVADVVAENFDGPARVEMRIDGWVEYQGFSVGDREGQTCVLAENVPDQQRLDVIISPEVFDRLRSLGIDNPREHFIGKRVIVSGTVHRNNTPFDSVSVIIWVNELDQIESIIQPDAE